MTTTYPKPYASFLGTRGESATAKHPLKHRPARKVQRILGPNSARPLRCWQRLELVRRSVLTGS